VWLPTSEVVDAIADGQVLDGMSLTALTWCLAFGRITPT